MQPHPHQSREPVRPALATRQPAASEPVPPAIGARALTLPADADAAAFVRGALANVLAQVRGNLDAIAGDRYTAEHVHQLRVGLRRLRTLLRELEALHPGFDGRHEPALRQAFRTLGAQRDDAAVAEAVRPLLQAAGAPLMAWAPRPASALPGVVHDAPFLAVLDALSRFATQRRSGKGPTATASETRAHLARRLQRLHRQVTRDGKRFDTLGIEAQHRTRKRLKRLRYLAEFAQALWPGKASERYLRQLRPAQERLGEHNDCAVAAERFRDEATRDPRAWFAAGFLQAHLATTGHAAMRSLKTLDDAQPFWRD